jgi:hypothetical protein
MTHKGYDPLLPRCLLTAFETVMDTVECELYLLAMWREERKQRRQRRMEAYENTEQYTKTAHWTRQT